jgi:WD40 repeat protein
VFDAVFDPNGITCAVETANDVKILTADTFKVTTSLPYRNIKTMRFTSDGKYILLVLEPKTLVLWDIAESDVVQELTIDLPESIEYAYISNDCRTVYVRDSADTRNVIHLAF